MGKQARRQRDGTWRRKGSESVLRVAGTQDVQAYIYRRQVTVAQWVALRTIFKVCVQETHYKGGRQKRAPWWWWMAVDDQLRGTLKYISGDAQEQRRRESDRCGGREDQKGADNGK